MRHVMPPRLVSKHRPRSRSLSRADHAEARASDIVLAVTGIVLLGALALYAALMLIERAGAV